MTTAAAWAAWATKPLISEELQKQDSAGASRRSFFCYWSWISTQVASEAGACTPLYASVSLGNGVVHTCVRGEFLRKMSPQSCVRPKVLRKTVMHTCVRLGFLRKWDRTHVCTAQILSETTSYTRAFAHFPSQKVDSTLGIGNFFRKMAVPTSKWTFSNRKWRIR